MADKIKQLYFLKAFLLVNTLILFVGLTGLSNVDKAIFHFFINEGRYDGTYVLNKWQQIHTAVQVICITLIWLLYVWFSIKRGSKHKVWLLLLIAMHCILWSIIYVLYHFAVAGLLS